MIDGVKRKVHFFVLSLPHSDGIFVKAYPGDHRGVLRRDTYRRFRFLGGVPQSILYDNTKLAVCEDTGRGQAPSREGVHRATVPLPVHRQVSGRPGRGNDKGNVEGMVGYSRRNFLVPIPSFESFDALNLYLEGRCLERMEARLRGHRETIGERMKQDLTALLPLPAAPYDASDKHGTRVNSLSLVRYRTNDYSVSGGVRSQGRSGERVCP